MFAGSVGRFLENFAPEFMFVCVTEMGESELGSKGFELEAKLA